MRYGRGSRETARRSARAPACRPISVSSAAAWTAVSRGPGEGGASAGAFGAEVALGLGATCGLGAACGLGATCGLGSPRAGSDPRAGGGLGTG